MHLIALEYLTTKQALESLKSCHGLEMDEEDLLSYCGEHRCQAYAKTYSKPGWMPDSIQDFYATGHQKILNPTDLLNPGIEVLLCLLGDVRTEQTEDGTVLQAQEWQLKILKSEIQLYFATVEIEALADLIKKTKKTSNETDLEKALLIIARMKEIILSGSSIRKQKYITEDLVNVYASFPGMGTRTIDGLLSDANKAKKALGLKPNPNLKIAMQNSLLQMQ